MAVDKVIVNGREYPVAPLAPEHHDHPTPAYLQAITPEVARAWLGHNWRNRNQREKGKRNYGADMKERNFAINGTTITFSRPLGEGEDPQVPAGQPVLMDGQHRLEACVASRAPFVTYVAYGIDPGVRSTIDTGIKRSFGDVLALRGEHNTNVLAAVIKRVHAYESGDTHLTLKKVTATHAQMDEFLILHPEIRRSAEIASRTRADFDRSVRHPLRQSVAGLAHWLLVHVDESRTPAFFARVGDGDELKYDHPIAQLRRRFVRDLTMKVQIGSRRDIPKIEDWVQLCYYIRAWNASLLWEAATEEQRVEVAKFAWLGPTDQQKIPEIRTIEWARKQMEARAAAAAAEGRESA